MGGAVKTVKGAVNNVKSGIDAAKKGDLKGAARAAITFSNPLTGKMEAGLLGLNEKEKKAGGGGGGKVAKQPSLGGVAGKYESLMDASRRQNLEANQRLTTNLENQAYGKSPSLAEAQLRSTQSRNLAQTLAAAQAAGASPLNTRNLINARGTAGRDTAELAGIQKLQERQLAQQQLGQQLGNQANIVRGDIAQGFGIAKSPIDLQQQQYSQDSAQNHALQMQQIQIQAQKDAAQKQFQQQLAGQALGTVGTIGMAMSDEDNKQPITKKGGAAETLEQKRKKALAKSMSEIGSIAGPADAIQRLATLGATLLAQQKSAAPATAAIPAMAIPNYTPDAGAAAMNFMPNGMAVSDETAKQPSSGKGMSAPKQDVQDFMDKLEPSHYEYKDASQPGTEPGPRYGVMAQDLERSNIGKTLVKNTPNGKMVDTVQGFGAVLAAQAALNKRLKAVEAKKGAK